MALFGVAQSGYNSPGTNGLPPGLNCQSITSSDDFVMLDGTEAIVTGSLSVHFSAQYAPGGGGSTAFFLTGCPGGSTVTIQGSNGLPRNNLTGEFLTPPTVASFGATFSPLQGESMVGSTTAGSGLGTANCLDTGSCTFYRASVDNLVSGDKPVLIAKRR